MTSHDGHDGADQYCVRMAMHLLQLYNLMEGLILDYVDMNQDYLTEMVVYLCRKLQ